MTLKLSHLVFLCSFFLIANCGFGQNDSIATAQHRLLNMPVGNINNAPHNPRQGASWFPKAGLGLFIHWGAIATYGEGDISWCMLENKSWDNDGTVIPTDYYGLMENWNPKAWNPDELMRQAKAAGFQYAVFTAKHHDGYTMWPSNYGDLGTQTKMSKRDLLKPYVDACRKYGLKVGIYFSPPDWWFDRNYRNWSFNDSIFLDMRHQKITPPIKPVDHDRKRRELVANQVRELLTKYGKIDLLWFDGGSGEISNEQVRKLQPDIVINRRNDDKGDYGDSEGDLPTKRFAGWFETCRPEWPLRWWSHVPCSPYASAAAVLSDLIKLRAWGGNLLANIAPLGDGSIPSQATEAMREMAAWMEHSQESVIDVESGNYPAEASIPVTVKGNVIYAFALTGYLGKMSIKVLNAPKRAYLLKTKQPVSTEYVNGEVTIKISAKFRTLLPDVVKLEF